MNMNQAQVFIEKLIRDLMRIEPRRRLELLIGGLVAAADELRIGEAQLVGLVKTAIAQRAKALEQLRKGGPLLVGPNGLPLAMPVGEVPAGRDTVESMRAAGRPDSSSCRCEVWPCGCACHKSERAAVAVSGAVGEHDPFESWDSKAAETGDTARQDVKSEGLLGATAADRLAAKVSRCPKA